MELSPALEADIGAHWGGQVIGSAFAERGEARSDDGRVAALGAEQGDERGVALKLEDS